MTTIALQGLNLNNKTKHQSNNELFSTLVTQYADDLFRYAYWLAGSKTVAEDLVQDTLMRAWKSVHRLNDQKAVKSWLFTIVRRENARRFERKQAEFSNIESADIAEKKTQYDTSTEAFVLRRALEQLPIEYREPLLLQVEYGFSQKEIANQLGISTAGAGTRLFRARNKLKQILEGK